jgi:hypothetical protein
MDAFQSTRFRTHVIPHIIDRDTSHNVYPSTRQQKRHIRTTGPNRPCHAQRCESDIFNAVPTVRKRLGTGTLINKVPRISFLARPIIPSHHLHLPNRNRSTFCFSLLFIPKYNHSTKSPCSTGLSNSKYRLNSIRSSEPHHQSPMNSGDPEAKY